MRLLAVSTIIFAGLLISGCTYKTTGTSKMTKIDGTKVDYSNMDKYISSRTCVQVGSREDSSLSVFEAAKKAGIKNIVYVDQTVTRNEVCVIVYGE